MGRGARAIIIPLISIQGKVGGWSCNVVVGSGRLGRGRDLRLVTQVVHGAHHGLSANDKGDFLI